MSLASSGKLLVFAEQKQRLSAWQNFLKVLYRNRETATGEIHEGRFSRSSTLDARANRSSSTRQSYEQLIEAFGLTPDAIANTVANLASPRYSPKVNPSR